MYVTGHSNGAMMAYRLAVEAADRIAAMGAVAGMMVGERFSPARTGRGAAHPQRRRSARALRRGSGRRFPGRRSPCHARSKGPGALDDPGPLPHRAAVADVAECRRGATTHTAELLVHEPCESDAAGGAVAPDRRRPRLAGGTPPLPERIMGPETTVINAAEEMWKFVSRFAGPTPAAAVASPLMANGPAGDGRDRDGAVAAPP